MLSKTLFLTVLSTSAYAATAPVYGQCGGQGWTGATTCASGSTCTYSNAYYSQCLPGSAAPVVSSVKTSTTSKAAVKVTSTTAAASKAPTSAPVSGGTTYKASFTQYGAGDTFGSGNCQTTTTACGFYSTGYNAAVSQNEFGVGPGAGAGPACGTCWKLTAETNSGGGALSNAGNSIVVQVTNLCPASGNPLCSQNGLGGTNQYGANLNFDLCIQSGANTALFGNSGVGLAVGTAVQVDCSAHSGTIVG
jgi:hypothetical protein